MRIAYIAAGAGGMLCGSCIRDNALAAELQRLGHDAVLVPIYTPLRTDEPNVAIDRVFYGAINVYLQQKNRLFRYLPGPLRHLLDHPAVLRRIPTDNAVDARELGALAQSMLEGEHGRQQVELEELVSWLRDELRPEIIHLTNSMLLGLVHRLREELPDARIVCAMQGEDIFLNDLDDTWRPRVLDTMRERAGECDLFLATSEFYALAMAELLHLPAEKVVSARLGIQTSGYPRRDREPDDDVSVIGYLARVCPEKGLHVLLDAFRELCRHREPRRLKLRIAGYQGGRDRHYADEQRQRVRDWGLEHEVEFLGEVDRRQKIELLHSLHVFSVPTVYREPKGLPVLEAMAIGVPVVQPDHGAFPEIIERTGGGIVTPAGDPIALAEALAMLLDDPAERERLAVRGAEGVRRHHSVETMAADTLAAYARLS